MIKFISETQHTDEYPCSRIEMTLPDPEGFSGVLNEFIHFALAMGFQTESIVRCMAEKVEELTDE